MYTLPKYKTTVLPTQNKPQEIIEKYLLSDISAGAWATLNGMLGSDWASSPAGFTLATAKFGSDTASRLHSFKGAPPAVGYSLSILCLSLALTNIF